MPILLTTFGLLLLLSLSAISQLGGTKNTTFLTIASLEAAQKSQELLEKRLSLRAKTLYKRYNNKDSKNEDPFSDELDEQQAIAAITPDHERSLRAPKKEKDGKSTRTSFLHVSSLFSQDTPNLLEGKAKAAFILLQAYIQELYHDQEFYSTAKQHFPDLEERIVRKWIDQSTTLTNTYGAKGKLDKAKEIGTLDLDDEQLMYVRYKMFSGASPRDRGKNGPYSLAECISVKENPCLMSVWLAPRPLLMALFQNEHIVDDVLAWRKETYYELVNRKSPTLIQTKSADFKSKFALYIPDSISKDLIDFEVSCNRLAVTN